MAALRIRAQQPASVWDGVYTQAQADKGKADYADNCASCHGQMLEGGGANPALAGDAFKGDYDGQTLDDLFEKIQATMPADHPGDLTRDQNALILSFILSANQFPAGTQDLPTDAAALAKIHFVAAKPQ
jgi:S-disulfanyl-L-cysteine oxidoreductase SoxD